MFSLASMGNNVSGGGIISASGGFFRITPCEKEKNLAGPAIPGQGCQDGLILSYLP
jgi:hypothetical protein